MIRVECNQNQPIASEIIRVVKMAQKTGDVHVLVVDDGICEVIIAPQRSKVLYSTSRINREELAAKESAESDALKAKGIDTDTAMDRKLTDDELLFFVSEAFNRAHVDHNFGDKLSAIMTRVIGELLLRL